VHTDIPTRADVERLLSVRDPAIADRSPDRRI
jgi:hypothetical protein